MNHDWLAQNFPQYLNLQENDVTYLDSAATSLICKNSLDVMNKYYLEGGFSTHGSYSQAARLEEDIQQTRDLILDFLQADKAVYEVVFTSGATESVNLVANSWALENLTPGQTILLSKLEHHANYLPWAMVAEKKQIELKFIALNPDGSYNFEQFKSLILSQHPALVVLSSVSNVLGLSQDLNQFTSFAKQHGVKIIVDITQSVAHTITNMNDLNADWLAFSGHKMYGPKGIGVLVAKKEVLQQMPPYKLGGEMVLQVLDQEIIYQNSPFKFEAGTKNFPAILGLKESCLLLSEIFQQDLNNQETENLQTLISWLESHLEVKILGGFPKLNLVSFKHSQISSLDLATYLGSKNILTRAGMHCAQPLHQTLGFSDSLRISLGVYNQQSDIFRLIEQLEKAFKILA